MIRAYVNMKSLCIVMFFRLLILHMPKMIVAMTLPLLKGTLWPIDAKCIPYVGDWNYWYRVEGHQTTTDDVLVAYLATARYEIFPELDISSPIKQVSTYVDLGCGIGSTLFLVAHELKPQSRIVGIEAQYESTQLSTRTSNEILSYHIPQIEILHHDLRNTLIDSDDKSINSLYHACDLVTANPPYAPLTSGTHNKDPQRIFANFELRGGIEEYALCARKLLAEDGRFVVAFWYKDRGRVEQACHAAGLDIVARLDVFMGRMKNINPHLSIFETQRSQLSRSCTSSDYLIKILNINRDPLTNGLNEKYKYIQNRLNMKPRPLKPSKSR